jgi:ferric-dicitrate binding protein FerR (iron transport regulator)
MMPDKRIWELLAKQFNTEISEEEVRELYTLLHSHRDAIAHAELLSDIHALLLKPGMEEKARKENSLAAIQKAIREKKAAASLPGDKHDQERGDREEAQLSQGEEEGMVQGGWRRTYRWMGGIAAVFCCCIAGYFLIKHHAGRNGRMESFDKIVTRPGSKTLINLPDSSSVILNSASQFSYNKDFAVTSREMQLSGEAYFDIHKNPDMPLVIHAGNVIIRVLGTTFNVRANPEDSFVEATLLKGSIEVSLQTDPERKILLHPNEKIVIRNNELESGNKITAHKRDDVITVSKVQQDLADSSYLETVWTKEKMSFQKESFITLAAKMERWYNVKIILADTALNNLLFTGSLEKEGLDEALQALRKTAPFNYTITGKVVHVTQN